MGGKNWTKKQCQQAHARRRAKERFGIRLTKAMRLDIIKKIGSNKTRKLGKQSLRVTGHEVEIEGKLLKVLYDKKRKSIVTILPPGAVWDYEVGAEPEKEELVTAPERGENALLPPEVGRREG